MDTRLLSRFVAVVELGSFNRAAQKLNLSQPALSKSIRLLEEKYGVELITRSPRGVSPTAFGQSVYSYAKLIATELGKMDEEIGAMRDLTLGVVNVGSSPGAAFTNNILAPAIVRLAKAGRRLVINSRVGPRNLLIGPLLLGELDFAITVLTESNPDGLVQEELYKDPLLFVVRPGHALARRKDLRVGDLVDFPWIVPDEDAHATLQQLAGADSTSIQHAVLRCNASNLIKALVISSNFIALVRDDMVRLDLKGGEYVTLSLSRGLERHGLLGAQKMGLVYRGQSALSRSSQALIDEIRRSYRRPRASARHAQEL